MIDSDTLAFLLGLSTIGWGVYRLDPFYFNFFLLCSGVILILLAFLIALSGTPNNGSDK